MFPMKVAMIQATYRAVEPMVAAFRELSPEVQVVQFVNEQMLAAVNRRGCVGTPELRMFTRLMFEAMESDADCILVCCSIFCSYVPLMRNFTDKPIVAINEPMLEKAASCGGVIGVVSTTPTSGPHTQEQIEAIMAKTGAKAAFQHEIIPEAAKALAAGDAARHDRIVADAAQKLINAGCSCVILSQITMAGGKKLLPPTSTPVLTSPEEGAKHVWALLNKSR